MFVSRKRSGPCHCRYLCSPMWFGPSATDISSSACPTRFRCGHRSSNDSLTRRNSRRAGAWRQNMIDATSVLLSGRALVCVSILFAAAVARPASAQNIAAPKPTPEVKSAEIAPRGQREAKDITYGGWTKLCVRPAGTPMLCRTSITGRFATGQMAIRVDLIERDGDPIARLQVFVPVGMYLQKPVKLTIDGANVQSLPYTWCLSNTCIAADAADPKF